MISIEEKERILKFIKKPIKTGIWETIFEWNNNNEIVLEIFRVLRTTHYDVAPIIITPIMILEIFNFFVQEKRMREDGYFLAIFAKPNFLKHIDDNVFKNLKNNFENFDEIYNSMKMYEISIYNNNIIMGEEYVNILQQPYYSNSRSYNNMFIILSTNKRISDYIKIILESVQCITNTKQRLVRSPQTKLINPIFDFTKFISYNLFTDWENTRYFDEAYNLYYQRKYDNSISYIGKMTESLLTNIYESLFQEHVPDGFAIGQIQNSLQSRVRDIYNNKKNIESANFEEIREHCKNNMDVIPLIHQITTLLKEEQKYRDSLLLKNQNKNTEYSIFPKYILINLKKILNYRNAVSHNSGRFFNQNDCQKMLFYFLSVHNWWQETYDKIDWTGDKIEIIKKIVESKSS